MNLTEILADLRPLVAPDKKGAIFELVDAAASGRVLDAESLKDAVWTGSRPDHRHRPRARHPPRQVPRSPAAMAIGKPAQPLDFAAIDQKPVRLIVLLASPPDKTSDHIQALAKISRLMADGEFREKLYNAMSADELYAMLTAREHVAS